MGYSRFELTEIELQFDPARLPQLAAVAAASGLLKELDPVERDAAELPPGRWELEEVLGELFPDYWELDGDLWLQAEVTWYQGAWFPENDAWDAFAAAAKAGSHIAVLDFDGEYRTDIYDVVFDGAGGWDRVDWVIDGVPVRSAARGTAR